MCPCVWPSRCPTGSAVVTPGFELPAGLIIHAVGPRYVDDNTSAPLLYSAYSTSIKLAAKHGCRSLAFPAISCGIYGYPVESAARVAVRACMESVRVGMVSLDFCFVDDKIHAFAAAAE